MEITFWIMAEHDLPHEAPIAGTELETMLGSLEQQRAIFSWKCGGLDSAGLQASHPPSKLSAVGRGRLGGRRLLGEEWGDPGRPGQTSGPACGGS